MKVSCYLQNVLVNSLDAYMHNVPVIDLCNFMTHVKCQIQSKLQCNKVLCICNYLLIHAK